MKRFILVALLFLASCSSSDGQARVVEDPIGEDCNGRSFCEVVFVDLETGRSWRKLAEIRE